MSEARARRLDSRGQVRSLDRTAIERFRHSRLRADDAARARRPSPLPTTALARCPALARALRRRQQRGRRLCDCPARARRRTGRRVCALSEPAQLAGDAATAWQDFAANRVAPGALRRPPAARGGPRGRCPARHWPRAARHGRATANAIDAVNAAGADPSSRWMFLPGLDGPTGLPPWELAVRADATVTFVGRKLGLYLGDGPDFSGPRRVLRTSASRRQSWTAPVSPARPVCGFSRGQDLPGAAAPARSRPRTRAALATSWSSAAITAWRAPSGLPGRRPSVPAPASSAVATRPANAAPCCRRCARN